MSQSSAIAASLIVAFIVFITVRGQLPCYMEILGISTAGQCGALKGVNGSIGISLTGGGGGISISTPSIGVGPVTVQPPVIRI